jgi:hypothetical protein
LDGWIWRQFLRRGIFSPDSCVGCNIRRSGQIFNVFLTSNPCNTTLGLKNPFPQDCWDGRLWTANGVARGENLEIGHGDSGGPLMFDVDLAIPPVVAGVTSSWLPPELAGPDGNLPIHTKWATTGDNADFIWGALSLPFTLSLAAQMTGTAIFTTGTLNVNDRAHVFVNQSATGGARVVSDGAIYIGVETFVGDVFTRTGVQLRDRSTAANVVSHGGVSVGNGVHVGSITQGKFQIYESFTLPVTFTTPSTQLNINAGSVVSLSPGAYGNVTVYSGGTLNLAGGVYAFSNPDCEPNCTIALTGTGPTWIFNMTTGSIILRGVVGANATNLFMGIPRSAVVDVGNTFNGTIVAPNADVDVDMVNGAVMSGSVFAKTFTLHEGEFFRFAPFSGRWIPVCTGSGGFTSCN